MNDVKVKIIVEKFRTFSKVVILNCIDSLYGHSLLKLLNAERHLQPETDIGLVVIVQSFLRWMVPKGVAEIWTVELPLNRARNYYPDLNESINKECGRFDEIYVSRAHAHPKKYDVSKFTGVDRHDFNDRDFRITFVWREDRLWCEYRFFGMLPMKSKWLKGISLFSQNRNVRRLFLALRRAFPQAVFSVAGLGRGTRFPSWIDDRRVDRFSEDGERQTCKIYSESRLVIGVHGSNMLLPTAHGGMAIDLMPLDRWGNFAQDILYPMEDLRLSAYRFRCLPSSIDVKLLAHIAEQQLRYHSYFKRQMTNEIDE